MPTPWDSLQPLDQTAPAPAAPSATTPWSNLKPLPDPPPPPPPQPQPDLPWWQPDPSAGFAGATLRGVPIVGRWPGYAAAAVKSTSDYLSDSGTGQPWSDYYRKNVEQLREPERQWETAHPYQSVAADVLGGVLGTGAIGAATGGAGLVPQAGRLIANLGVGSALGAGGGALNAVSEPNWTAPGLLGSTVSGALAGATTALPGLLTAAKASGLTLKELSELATKISLPLTGGAMTGHPLIGAAAAVPGALQAAVELGKVLAQRVPPGLLSFAPAVGAEASRFGSKVGNLWSDYNPFQAGK
jgi:hypothetical protein